MGSERIVLDVNTFWLEYKDFMYSMGLGPDIETVWAFLEEHSRTEISEDVLDEARNEAADEAHEIGREEGYDSGHEEGYNDGYEEAKQLFHQVGYDSGYQDAKDTYDID